MSPPPLPPIPPTLSRAMRLYAGAISRHVRSVTAREGETEYIVYIFHEPPWRFYHRQLGLMYLSS